MQTGEIDKKPYKTLQIIAKYYYHCLGYRKKRIINLLTEFMQKNYPQYSVNILAWADTIEKIASKAGRYPLYEISEVYVTQNEIDKIETIKRKNLRVLAFTLLCLAKLGNLKKDKNNSWVNTEIRDIFKLAHINTSAERQDYMLGDLVMLGLLEIPKKNESLSFRVTFIDDKSNSILSVSDFRELGYEYLKYKGENIIRCANCRILIRGNKNNTKRYCSDCAGYIPMGTKTIVCADCGKEIQVSAKNNQSYRCADCQRIQKRNKNKEWMKKKRNEKI